MRLLQTMSGRWLVRDHIPLEQGLRQHRTDCPERARRVRDHIPLEQGLRQNLIKQKK